MLNHPLLISFLFIVFSLALILARLLRNVDRSALSRPGRAAAFIMMDSGAGGMGGGDSGHCGHSSHGH